MQPWVQTGQHGRRAWGKTRGWLQGPRVLPHRSRVCMEKAGRRGFCGFDAKNEQTPLLPKQRQAGMEEG